MKVLFVITGLGVGGAERQVCDLADRFCELGHKVLLVYMTGDECVKPNNSEIEILSLGITKDIISILRGITKFRKIINNFKPNILHSHMVHANIFSRVAAIGLGRGVKIISTAHNTNEGGRIRMLAYRLTDSLANISTNVGLEAVEAFEKKGAVPKGRMLAVHNGIDTNKFFRDEAYIKKYKNNDEKIFIAVGRLSEAKDYPNLIDAFYIVNSSHEKCRLWIVGDGPLRRELIEKCQKMGLYGKVDFFGVRKDVEKLLNLADYFVLSSAWEGLPLVVAEAMATEKIVIATDCGGVAEIVEDSEFLVPPKNSIMLAEAMQKALNMDLKDVEERGRKSRLRVVESFNLDKIVDRWISVYNKY